MSSPCGNAAARPQVPPPGAQAASASPPAVAAPRSEEVEVAEAPRWADGATTAMVRNIPSRYTAEELLAEMLAQGFEGCFDFFYLPMDFATKRNRGYSFVNFRSPEQATRFAKLFHRRRLTRYTSQKILEVCPALTQGFHANVAQYAGRDVQRVQNPWFRPMIFATDAEDTTLEQAPR